MEINNQSTERNKGPNSNNFEEEIIDYIHNMEEENLMEILSKRKLPIWDYRDKENKNSTLLNISTYKKSFNITKLLIDYCKNNNSEMLEKFINLSNDDGITPLHYSSFKGDVPIIKLLIENGADIKKKTNNKLNVIHYCAQGNKPNALMYFYLKLRENNNNIKKEYEIFKEKDNAGSTPLHWAVYSGAEDFLLYLLNIDIFDSEEEKINYINQLDDQGYSALLLSVSSKSVRILMKLLQNGADTSVVNKKGQTALQVAIKKKQTEMIQILRNSESCQFCNVKAPVKQIKKSSKNIICVFTFQFVATIIFFISCIPLLLFFYDNIYTLVVLYIYIFLLFLFFLIYIILLIKDPGLKRKKGLDELQELINKNIDLTYYCYKCYVLKTPSLKHCIICDSCYERFDHHCYWINKCVAKRNFSLFILFLVETALYLIFALAINILSLIKIKSVNNFDVDEFSNKYNYFDLDYFKDICQFLFKDRFILHLTLNILLIVIILSFLIPEFLLLILHINVIASNYRERKNRINPSIFSANTIMTEDNTSLLISNKASKD